MSSPSPTLSKPRPLALDSSDPSCYLPDMGLSLEDLGDLGEMLPLPNRRANQPFFISYIRPIEEADLLAAESVKPPPVRQQTLRSIRGSHHEAARLVGLGKTNAEISLITGYSAETIKSLKRDPSFQELIAHYQAEVREVYIDTHRRLAGMTNDFIEILHERGLEKPDSLKTEDIIKAISLGADRTGFGPKATINSNVVVTHVELERIKQEAALRSQGSIKPLSADSGPPLRSLIDITPTEIRKEATLSGEQSSGDHLREEVPRDAEGGAAKGAPHLPLSVD